MCGAFVTVYCFYLGKKLIRTLWTLNTANIYVFFKLHQFYRHVFALKHATTVLELHTLGAIKHKARVTLASFKTGFVAGKRGQ